MNEQNRNNWHKKYPDGKAFLSWNLADYLAFDLEPTPAVMEGKTEGQIMDVEEISSWALEEMRCLSVFREEYPNKFPDQYRNYLLDLEYLESLGKISEEEKEKLAQKDNFEFGKE